MANRSDATTGGGRGGINTDLLIIGILAVIGVVIAIFMGTGTFSTAGVTIPVVVLFLWAMFIGVVFSTIVAAGGILSGVGHLSVYGMQNANDVKPMNQVLTLVNPFFSVPTHLRQKRLVLQLGILLGIGSIAGSLLGSWFSSNVLSSLESYKRWDHALRRVPGALRGHEPLLTAQAGIEHGLGPVRASGPFGEHRVGQARRRACPTRCSPPTATGRCPKTSPTLPIPSWSAED